MNDRNFDYVFRTARAGSRALLFGVQDLETIQSFASRGFRLFLVAEKDDILQYFKKQLREAGLSSQLMGGAVWGDARLSLASNFYELAVVCSGRFPPPRILAGALRVGSEVFWVGPDWIENGEWQVSETDSEVWKRARLVRGLSCQP